MRTLRRLGIFLLVGAVLGDVVAMLIAPRIVTWFESPGAGTALCNCVDLARQTAGSLIRAQLIGAAIGAVSLAVLGEIVVRVRASRRRKREAAAGAATPAAQGGAALAGQKPPPA